MKKTAMLVLLVSLCSVIASGQWLAYDFKASIKRLDNKLGIVKYSPDVYDGVSRAQAVFESYSTVSDTLTGLLFVPECASCCNCGEPEPNSQAILFIKRKGDKTKALWEFNADFITGAFGKKAAMRCGEDVLAGGPTSLKGLDQAWANLFLTFDEAGTLEEYGKFGLWPYGFLGFCSGAGEITCTGFGKVKTLIQSTTGNCNESAKTSACVELQSVSGQLTGTVEQIGGCSEPPIWELCSFGEFSPAGQMRYDAVVSGSWSLKLNRKLSSLANTASPEEIALGKLK